jgi:glycosyltransferase involved in cell wall biosynthesis
MDLDKISFNPLPALDSASFVFRGLQEQRPRVSLIIPTLNEEKNLPLVLPFIPMDWVDEVVLVDGRSSDQTVETARKMIPSIRVVIETRHGKGVALHSGYMASTGDILIVMDADGSHDPREIPRFIAPLLAGADMVKGSRFAPGGGTTDMPRFRKWGNGWFVRISNLLFGKDFTDLCYGFHAFWYYCLDKLDLDSIDGFEIDTSLYLQAVRKNYHLVEVPSFEGYRFHGIGKLKTFPDGFRVLRTIYREWLASLHQKEPQTSYGFRGFLPGTKEVDSTNYDQILESQHKLVFDIKQLFRKMLRESSGQKDTLRDFLSRIMDMVDAQSSSIFLLDEHREVEYAFLVYGRLFFQYDAQHVDDLIQNGLAGWVIKNNKPALVKNIQEDPRWIRRDWDQGQVPVSRSALSLPMAINGGNSAVLTLVRNKESHFTEKDLLNVSDLLTVN